MSPRSSTPRSTAIRRSPRTVRASRSNGRRARPLAFQAPVHDRAHTTVDELVRATESLLENKPFEDLTIREIVQGAGRTIGSFYARFSSKEALLPYLYARYDQDLEALIDRRIARVPWDTLTFEQAVEALVEMNVAIYLDRRWLIRAMALFARSRPDAIPEEVRARRKLVIDRSIALLLPHARHITHPDPEQAIRFGFFMLLSTAREKLVFGEAPLARNTNASREALTHELTTALLGYLTCPPRARKRLPTSRRSRRSP